LLGGRCFFGSSICAAAAVGIREGFVMFRPQSRLTTSKVAFFKVIQISRVYAPVVATTVAGLADFDEALVERQVVTNTIAPTLVRATLVVGKILNYPIVNFVEQNFAVKLAENGHGYERYVGMWRPICVVQVVLLIISAIC
jgi:hypothetical protein